MKMWKNIQREIMKNIYKYNIEKVKNENMETWKKWIDIENIKMINFVLKIRKIPTNLKLKNYKKLKLKTWKNEINKNKMYVINRTSSEWRYGKITNMKTWKIFTNIILMKLKIKTWKDEKIEHIKMKNFETWKYEKFSQILNWKNTKNWKYEKYLELLLRNSMKSLIKWKILNLKIRNLQPTYKS